MTNDMAGSMFIHPPGGLPDGAPKGLVDVWMSTSPPLAEQTKQAVMDAVHTHALAISLWAVALILLIGVSIWFFRDWRGHLLRCKSAAYSVCCTVIQPTRPSPSVPH